MSKITLTDLVNLQNETTAVNAINTNNAALRTASDKTLSRDGTSPNQMTAAIDMNNNQIYNLPAPSTVNSPARLIDVTSNPTIVVPGTGTSGHTVPFLDGNNTWSGTNTYSANATFNSTSTFNGVASMTNPSLTHPTMTTPILGTPASGTLTNCTGLPVSTGVSGLGTNVSTFLTTPSSANLVAAVTDETGTGPLVFRNSPTLVTPVLGVATGTSLAVTGALTSSSPTAGIGYVTGAGGTVTQATSKSTGVTLNTLCGQIIMNGAVLNTGVIVSFTMTNSTIAATDVMILNHQSVGTVAGYILNAQCQNGSAIISLRNNTASNLSEAIVLSFAVIKAVTS